MPSHSCECVQRMHCLRPLFVWQPFAKLIAGWICLLAVWLAPDRCLPQESSERVRKLFSERCFACHGPDAKQRQGGLRLDVQESFRSAADSGEVPVVPGDPKRSEIWKRITSSEEGERMPPPEFGIALTAEEIALVAGWIDAGAEWTQHWSFQAPQRPRLPDFTEASEAWPDHLEAWRRNPLDRFVLHQQLVRTPAFASSRTSNFTPTPQPGLDRITADTRRAVLFFARRCTRGL